MAQVMKWNNFFSIFWIFAIAFWACKEKPKRQDNIDITKNAESEKPATSGISFNQENAFEYIVKQVSFGPRIPGSAAHRKCADFLHNELAKYAHEMHTQETTVHNKAVGVMPCYNIIGSFNPEAEARFLLCAHWDTRPIADEDGSFQPFDGADDGASGVAVLLEIARLIDSLSLPYGVDIIFFDVEDAGSHSGDASNSWCLGSQYWSKNPHKKNYIARKAILLDMVGSKNALFAFEGNSASYANDLLIDVWRMGQHLGYGNYFINLRSNPVTDDHVYVFNERGIPIIDIINYNPTTKQGFGAHWHTQNDNINIIDKKTLKAVGETVWQYLWKQRF